MTWWVSIGSPFDKLVIVTRITSHISTIVDEVSNFIIINYFNVSQSTRQKHCRNSKLLSVASVNFQICKASGNWWEWPTLNEYPSQEDQWLWDSRAFTALTEVQIQCHPQRCSLMSSAIVDVTSQVHKEPFLNQSPPTLVLYGLIMISGESSLICVLSYHVCHPNHMYVHQKLSINHI